MQVRQYQRRAIEKIVLGSPQTSFPSAANFFIDNKPVRVLGASVGVGTCSDVHGLDVLVLGMTGANDNYCPNFPDGSTICSCRHAVLIEDPTPEEFQFYRQSSGLQKPVLSKVRRLEIGRIDGENVYLEQTDSTTIYCII